MTTMHIIGYVSIFGLFGLLAIGMPIAWAMGIVGLAGTAYLSNFSTAASQLSLVVWDNGTSFVFIALPLFLLMGQLAFRTGITDDLYDCVHKWFGQLPGGLAVAAVLSNAGYGAVTGNSIASVATIGPIVMPQFRKHGYNLSFATGTLASAGTLAVLVPPSALMVIYGVWTETSIGDLFLAGIIPCLVLAFTYCAVLVGICIARPDIGPRGPSYPWSVRFRSLTKLLPTVAIIGVVLGGIYGGLMTPSESAGVGVAGVILIAAVMRRMKPAALWASLKDSLVTASMVYAIVVAGVLFSRLLVQTEVTQDMVRVITSWELSRVGLLLALLVFYFVLGTALDTFGMLVLSLPFVMPVIIHAGIDKVWFGVFVAIMVELAAVSPPAGITVAVMRSIAPDVPTTAIFKGCTPFLVLTILLTFLLIAVPELATWLPAQMK